MSLIQRMEKAARQRFGDGVSIVWKQLAPKRWMYAVIDAQALASGDGRPVYVQVFGNRRREAKLMLHDALVGLKSARSFKWQRQVERQRNHG